jgi:hypothetical protein
MVAGDHAEDPGIDTKNSRLVVSQLRPEKPSEIRYRKRSVVDMAAFQSFADFGPAGGRLRFESRVNATYATVAQKKIFVAK